MATINEMAAKLTGRKDFKLRRDSIFLSEVLGPLDHSTIADELGWNPRPIQETVKDAIAWFAQQKQAKSCILCLVKHNSGHVRNHYESQLHRFG